MALSFTKRSVPLCSERSRATLLSTAALVLWVRGAAGAAADADGPEEGGAEREGECKPVQAQYLCTDGEFDAITSEDGVERACEGREKDCGRDGGEEGEETCNLMALLASCLLGLRRVL